MLGDADGLAVLGDKEGTFDGASEVGWKVGDVDGIGVTGDAEGCAEVAAPWHVRVNSLSG